MDITDKRGKKVDIYVCSTCNVEKPRGEFKRFASLAQTRAWLNKPTATKRMTYYGKDCNACFKIYSRKPSELSPEELRKKLTLEGKPHDFISQAVAERMLAGKKRRQYGGYKALKKQREPLFQVLSFSLAGALRSFVSARNYAAKTNVGAEGVEFMDFAVAQAKIARMALNERRKAAGVPPECWQEFITDESRAELIALYNKLDGSLKDRWDWIVMAFQVQSVDDTPVISEIEDKWNVMQKEQVKAKVPDWVLTKPDKEIPMPEPTTTESEWYDLIK